MLNYNGIQPFACQRHTMSVLRFAQDNGNALPVISGSGVTVIPDSGRGSPLSLTTCNR